MQFSQPCGIPSYGQPFMLNPPNCYGYPNVIGEGNIASIISPEGVSQVLFYPTAQWLTPYLDPNTVNGHNPYWNNGVWIVRNMYNPIQPTVFNQPHPVPYSIQNLRGTNSDCCLNLPAPVYQLKFHNDNWTSTTDIHYFCPKQYCLFQTPQEFTAARADIAIVTQTDCNHEVVSKPCNCSSKQQCAYAVSKTNPKKDCSCKQSHTSNSEMSCQEVKSETCVCNKSKDRKSCKMKKSKSSKGSKRTCRCSGRSGNDKSVTTYCEQASGRAEDKGRQTQTIRKPTKSKSSATFSGVCESGCCSGSCSCNSDTE